ncbi:MAG: efflux RND transporter periplasmic adaptor subunit [Opitutaceae bacterium]|jgi:multidrug efflux pump subunit AcrA (membrane-fusion protein)|nr:efflux RND transporter periplasmic adaptor subunit [Opitutaceae bacterium]
MKLSFPICLFFTASLVAAPAAEREQSTVVLDANTVANLRLEFAKAETRLFEETAFALGRIEAAHASQAAVSSRISGRVVGLTAHLGDRVEAGAEIVRVESRQAGDPPPVVALRAPMAGTVTACAIHLGDPVEPDAALLEITDLSEVHAVARVPEAVAGRLRTGETRARIRLTAFPGETVTGELARIGTEADPATGTLEAHFRLPNPEGRFRPGMRAEFVVILASRPDVLAVPRAAVQGEGVAPRIVFVRDPALPNAFVKSPVVLGATNDRHVEILDGLAPGAEVVTTGAYSLSFAGGGALSLKEALDAAHGHEHAADGSELKPGEAHDHAGHDHDHGSEAGHEGHDHGPEPDHGEHDDHAHGHEHPERPWQIATALLALSTAALAIALARRRHA